MNYEEAFGAFNSGDYEKAAPLLEKAARETDYASDFINNAYTLALHKIGDKSRLGEVAFGIGELLAENDPASAMDYFQRAATAVLNNSRVRAIGEFYERLAESEQRASRSDLQKPINRVAHVIGYVSPSSPVAHYVKTLIPALKEHGIHSTVFTTESAARWFFNPDMETMSQPMDMNSDVVIASTEGDFRERAARIASAIRQSGVQAVLFHGNLTDQISARVASMRPAALQIHVAHDVEMEADLFDGRVYLFQNTLNRTRFKTPATWIPMTSDIETRLQMSEPVTRQQMGLEEASSLSATIGSLGKVSAGYLRALCEVMNRHPKHFHLFVGAGNIRSVRPMLHSEGVLPRVRFLGDTTSTAPILDVIDMYLDTFPEPGVQSILEAMGSGKPVVTMSTAKDSPQNAGAELVGAAEWSPSTEGGYIDIADRLLRSPELMARHGQAMLDRFRAEFRPSRVAARYKEFLGVL